MSTRLNDTYTGINKDGYLCTYDKETHLCVGIMDGTGNIPLTNEKRQSYLGQIDPKYQKSRKNGRGYGAAE
ncbi:MAG: hypothetical protein ACI4XH_02950 [Acutalibacteraceae bacterium]